jgi:SAM-dependent methyltransferase
LGDLVVTLPAVFEATIDGIPSAVVLHTEAAPPEDRSVDLLLCALLRRGKDRRPAVLDVYRERLLTGPRSGQADETLTRGSREFAAMWRRFAALANRMNIHSYLPAGTDIVAWDIGQLDWHGVRDVADVGCGTGRHLARLKGQDLRIIGVDPSIGALRRAAAETNGRGVTFITGDVAHLPIADDSADVVLAMHMLYNVDDIDQGLVEIRRVLRPGGRLLATTSSPYHLAEFGKLYEQSVRALCTDLPAGWHSGEPRLRRFDLDTGLPVLRRHFCEVDRRDLTLPLIYPEGEPVIHYLDTTRRWREPNLPPGLAWGSVIAEARRRIAEIIAAEGAFRASLREGGFACRT